MIFFDDLHFSYSLDRLLGLARAEVLHYPRGLTVEWANTDLDDLAKGLDNFANAIRQALGYLRGQATLELSPGMEGVVRPALNLLDNAIILDNYLSTPRDRIGEETAIHCFSMAFMASQELAVPCHRFIPLNSWRRNFRDNLPGDTQHLFPWYDIWSDEDELLLQEFIDVLPSLKEGDFSTFAQHDAARFRALFSDIRQDELFLSHLEQSHRLVLTSMRAIGGDLAIRLFFLAERGEPSMSLPDSVLSVGFHPAAAAAMDASPECEEDRHELLFLAAFAGPELEDEERHTIFQKVAAFLDGQAALRANGLLSNLRQWQERKLMDQELENALYHRWISLLDHAAARVDIPFSYKEGQFLHFVDRLQTTPLEVSSAKKVAPEAMQDSVFPLADKVKSFLDAFIKEIKKLDPFLLIMRPAIGAMMAKEKETPKSTDVPIPEGRLRSTVMPADGKFLAVESVKDFSKLINQKQKFYFTAISLDASGKFAEQPKPLTHASRLTPGKGKTWIVGIGDSKESLAKAITALEAGEMNYDKLDHICWIIYHPEENG